jgi:hypothetical protein
MFRNTLGTFQIAEQLVASHEGLSCMGLVTAELFNISVTKRQEIKNETAY